MTSRCGKIIAEKDIRCENEGTLWNGVVAVEYSIDTPYGKRKMQVIYCTEHFEAKKEEILADPNVIRTIGE